MNVVLFFFFSYLGCKWRGGGTLGSGVCKCREARGGRDGCGPLRALRVIRLLSRPMPPSLIKVDTRVFFILPL